jgi:hypothetical protein
LRIKGPPAKGGRKPPSSKFTEKNNATDIDLTKSAIELKAAQIAGKNNVTSELKIAPPNRHSRVRNAASFRTLSAIS